MQVKTGVKAPQSPRERVLARWPDAEAFARLTPSGYGGIAIFASDVSIRLSEEQIDEGSAWRAAADRMEGGDDEDTDT